MRKSNYFTKGELIQYKQHEPIFNDSQIAIINRKTPASEIETKTDENGNEYKSVKASYMKKLLHLVTGGNFIFIVKNKEIIQHSKEALVEASLSINGAVREQFGQHYLESKPVNSERTKFISSNIGNAYKSATTDALKKCMSEYGFCWDVYGQNPPKKQDTKTPLSHAEQKILERLYNFLSKAKSIPEIEIIYEGFTSNTPEASKELLSEASELLSKHTKRISPENK